MPTQYRDNGPDLLWPTKQMYYFPLGPFITVLTMSLTAGEEWRKNFKTGSIMEGRRLFGCETEMVILREIMQRESERERELFFFLPLSSYLMKEFYLQNHLWLLAHNEIMVKITWGEDMDKDCTRSIKVNIGNNGVWHVFMKWDLRCVIWHCGFDIVKVNLRRNPQEASQALSKVCCYLHASNWSVFTLLKENIWLWLWS